MSRLRDDIARLPLFADCRPDELDEIATVANDVDVEPGHVLAEEGTAGAEFFVVVEGEADVLLEGRHVGSLERGAFFGEMALLDRGPRTKTIRARTPMRLCRFDAQGFETLIDVSPSAARKIMQGVAVRFRETADAKRSRGRAGRLVSRLRTRLGRQRPDARAARKVFVSSVIEGFAAERAAVRDAVRALWNEGQAVRAVLAEDMAAVPGDPRSALLREVESSDLYVGVLGSRYGYVHPGSAISATEEEYERARAAGVPILLFVTRLREDERREPAQDAFVERVTDYASGHYVSFFENADQLRFEVYRAVSRALSLQTSAS